MRSEAPPTVRQIYALAGVLCDKAGEEFPDTRGEASALIERLRVEQGHPAPWLDDQAPGRPASRTQTRTRGTDKLARAVAAEVLRELR
jgi:hypothetical protein